MKKGFALIELIISVAISSIVMIAFVASFAQVQKTTSKLEDVMSLDSRASLIQLILENDLSGAFVPNIDPLTFAEAESKKPENKTRQKLDKDFYEMRDEEGLKELTFVTCNPLIPTPTFKPRVARIVYFIRDDIDNPGSKVFYRLQSIDHMEYADAKDDALKHEVVDGIKNLKFEYAFEEEPKEKEEGQDSEKPAAPKEEDKGFEKADTAKKQYKVVTEITEDRQEMKLPSFITARLELWENLRERRSAEYTFKFQVYAAGYNLPQLNPIVTKKDKPGQQKPQAGGANATKK